MNPTAGDFFVFGCLRDPTAHTQTPLTAANASSLLPIAYSFYRVLAGASGCRAAIAVTSFWEAAFLGVQKRQHAKTSQLNGLLDQDDVAEGSVADMGEPCCCGAARLNKART